MFMNKTHFVDMMKNQRLMFAIVFLIMLSALSLNLESFALTKITEPKGTESPRLTYTATSTNECFNETSFPRYNLAARPFGMIKSPNKVTPSIKLVGESITIKASGTPDITNWNFTLIEGNVSFSLDVVESNFEDDVWTFKTTPEIQRSGLYDLQLNCSAGDDYQTHAIQFLDERNYPFTFVHISDLHFPFYSPDINTTDIALNALIDIQTLDPDFIVVTGDLIQGPTLILVDPDTGKSMRAEIQFRLGIWYLDLFNLPVFYVHGNHEFSQSTLVPDNLKTQWYRYFGPTRYHNFTYLDWTFVGFGSSFEGLSQTELDNVSEILAQNSNDSTVLYYHYDFQSQATSLIKKYPIELTLYGHLHSQDMFLSKDTLYHQQAPLFYGAFSSLSINNATCLTVHSQTFNFELSPYIPPIPEETTPLTTETGLFPYVFSLLGIIVYFCIKKKKNH